MKSSKQFVRPTCSKPWNFTCIVCAKNHHKYGGHSECYKRFCDMPMCQTIFKTPEELKAHAEQWHKKNFCEKCNMTIRVMKRHAATYH